MEVTTRTLHDHAILHPLLTQKGWEVLPPVIMTTCLRGTLHTTTTELLQELCVFTNRIHKLMKTFSQVAIKYSTHIISNKRKLENKKGLVPLD